MTQQFRRQIEDFVCGHCGREVTGDGYTNHCPDCLWSKHLDVHPGDRAATCGGLMAPIAVTEKGGEYIITHKCEVCAHTKPNRTAEEDDFGMIVELASR